MVAGDSWHSILACSSTDLVPGVLHYYDDYALSANGWLFVDSNSYIDFRIVGRIASRSMIKIMKSSDGKKYAIL